MSDIEAGKLAGTKNILVQTGHKGTDKKTTIEPDHIAKDFLDAVKWIKRVERE